MSKLHQLKMVIVVNSDPLIPLFFAIVIGIEIKKYKIKQIIERQNNPKIQPKISVLSILVPFHQIKGKFEYSNFPKYNSFL